MKTKRDKVFIWPSWISKLVAGEVQCEWCYYFKAHYKIDKAKSTNFSLATWTINHNNLIKARRAELEALGYTVRVEDQNSFYYTPPGKNYTISGKADIVAIKSGVDDGCDVEEYIVEDAKTGKCKTSDFVQVLFYMYMLPVAHASYIGKDFSGMIVYRKGVGNQTVPSDAKNDVKLKNNIWSTINLIAGEEVHCRRVPSYNECQRCDICKGDCPSRV